MCPELPAAGIALGAHCGRPQRARARARPPRRRVPHHQQVHWGYPGKHRDTVNIMKALTFCSSMYFKIYNKLINSVCLVTHIYDYRSYFIKF